MAKKIKKMAKQMPIIDPNLEEVEEEHSFEIEYDEETNEALLVHHYRRQWGDGFDADVEHAYDIEQNTDLINDLMEILERQKQKVINKAIAAGLLIQKSTPEMIEGNPSISPKVHECDVKEKEIKEIKKDG